MKPHLLALFLLLPAHAIPPPHTEARATPDSDLAAARLADTALAKCKRALFPRADAGTPRRAGEPLVCALPSEFAFTWDRGCEWCRTCVWWCAKFEAGHAYTEKGWAGSTRCCCT